MKKQAIMGLALMLLMGCSSQKIETEKKEPMLTFQDIKEVEYGDSFEVSNLVKDVQGVIKDYPKLDTSKVGKQSLTFVVELDQTKKDFQFDIEVKDTKHPIIELKKDKITICYDQVEDTGTLKIGEKPYNYNTLEPKILKANGNNITLFNSILGTDYSTIEDLQKYMKHHKTETALAIFNTDEKVVFPAYIMEAIRNE